MSILLTYCYSHIRVGLGNFQAKSLSFSISHYILLAAILVNKSWYRHRCPSCIQFVIAISVSVIDKNLSNTNPNGMPIGLQHRKPDRCTDPMTDSSVENNELIERVRIFFSIYLFPFKSRKRAPKNEHQHRYMYPTFFRETYRWNVYLYP